MYGRCKNIISPWLDNSYSSINKEVSQYIKKKKSNNNNNNNNNNYKVSYASQSTLISLINKRT
jgi:tRNA A37 threonylcarbamoyltransferase TsaD